MSEVQNKAVITIDGVEYDRNLLPETVKTLINVYETWQVDLSKAVQDFNDAKMSIAKNEAAMRDLAREISTAVNAHNDSTKEEASSQEADA